VKDESPIKTSRPEGKTVGIPIIGGGTARAVQLMPQGRGARSEKDIKLVEVSFSLQRMPLRRRPLDATNMNSSVPGACGGERRHPQAVRARPRRCRTSCNPGGVPKDFVDKNPELVKLYVKDITAALMMRSRTARRP